MNSPENNPESLKLSPEKINQLLGNAFQWSSEILAEHGSRENSEIAIVDATIESLTRFNRKGSLIVMKLGDGFMLDFEIESLDDESVAQRFILGQNGRSEKNYVLYGTSILPNVIPDMLTKGMEKTNENSTSVSKARHISQNSDDLFNESLRPARDEDIFHFMEILERARFGSDPVNFDDFQRDYDKLVDEGTSEA